MGFICSAGSAGNNKAPVQNEMGNWWLCWGFPVCQEWLLGDSDSGGRFLPQPSQGSPLLGCVGMLFCHPSVVHLSCSAAVAEGS